MNAIKMIAIDLDDTLLHDDISLSSYTIDVLHRALEKGIKIVIATGRMFQSAQSWGQRIGIGDVPMICYTGAYIALCESGRVIRNETLDLSVAQRILDMGRETGRYMQVYIDDELYIPFRDERTDIYEWQCGVKAHVLRDDFWNLSKAPTKILFFERDPVVILKLKALMAEKFGTVTDLYISKPNLLEVNKKGVSKGAAVRYFCEKWNISTDEIMAFGNGDNDISLFRLTPWSFAVGNATEAAKHEAHFVTDTNNHDGVAKTIAEFLGRV